MVLSGFIPLAYKMVAQPARQRLRSSELLVQISSPRFLCYVVYHSVVSLPM